MESFSALNLLGPIPFSLYVNDVIDRLQRSATLNVHLRICKRASIIYRPEHVMNRLSNTAYLLTTHKKSTLF